MQLSLTIHLPGTSLLPSAIARLVNRLAFSQRLIGLGENRWAAFCPIGVRFRKIALCSQLSFDYRSPRGRMCLVFVSNGSVYSKTRKLFYLSLGLPIHQTVQDAVDLSPLRNPKAPPQFHLDV